MKFDGMSIASCLLTSFDLRHSMFLDSTPIFDKRSLGRDPLHCPHKLSKFNR